MKLICANDDLSPPTNIQSQIHNQIQIPFPIHWAGCWIN